MEIYILQGRSRHVVGNRLFTKEEAIAIASQPSNEELTLIPVSLPWEDITWNRKGGAKTSSPYPEEDEKTTIRVPKRIAYQVQQFAVWLANLP